MEFKNENKPKSHEIKAVIFFKYILLLKHFLVFFNQSCLESQKLNHVFKF